MIGMGRRGLGGTKRTLMGSDPDPVVRYADCPALVLRAEKVSVITSKARFQPLAAKEQERFLQPVRHISALARSRGRFSGR